MVTDNEINWTTGTDKPYGQTVYEQWQEKLGQNPTEAQLRKLRNNIKKLEVRLEELNQEHRRELKDKWTGQESSKHTLELIDITKDEISSLEQLLSEYNDESIDKKTPKPREVAEKFLNGAKNEGTNYTIDDYTYVMDYASKHADVSSVAEMIRNLREQEDCPTKLKKLSKKTTPERRWINYYHEYADNTRK